MTRLYLSLTILLLGCDTTALESPLDAGLPWPYTCGSLIGIYVACCPDDEVCEVETCSCTKTPPQEGVTVCRRLPGNSVTVCYRP